MLNTQINKQFLFSQPIFLQQTNADIESLKLYTNLLLALKGQIIALDNGSSSVNLGESTKTMKMTFYLNGQLESLSTVNEKFLDSVSVLGRNPLLQLSVENVFSNIPNFLKAILEIKKKVEENDIESLDEGKISLIASQDVCDKVRFAIILFMRCQKFLQKESDILGFIDTFLQEAYHPSKNRLLRKGAAQLFLLMKVHEFLDKALQMHTYLMTPKKMETHLDYARDFFTLLGLEDGEIKKLFFRFSVVGDIILDANARLEFEIIMAWLDEQQTELKSKPFSALCYHILRLLKTLEEYQVYPGLADSRPKAGEVICPPKLKDEFQDQTLETILCNFKKDEKEGKFEASEDLIPNLSNGLSNIKTWMCGRLQEESFDGKWRMGLVYYHILQCINLLDENGHNKFQEQVLSTLSLLKPFMLENRDQREKWVDILKSTLSLIVFIQESQKSALQVTP